MADGEKIIKRLSDLKRDRGNHETRWETLAPYIAPTRLGVLLGSFNLGQDQVPDIYDGEGQFAANIFANFIAGQIFNPARKWFGLKERREELNKQDDVREWIEESRDRMASELLRSNFYANAPETVIDWGGFGTGSLLTEERQPDDNDKRKGFRGLRFEATKTGRFYVAENAAGEVDTLYREFKYTAGSAVERFGLDNLSDAIKTSFRTGQVDKLYDFVHAIQPRKSTDQSKFKGAQGMPFQACYVERDSKRLVEEGGYEEFPAQNPRYAQTPGETYGRGLGELALHDMQSLNADVRMGLEGHALENQPPILVRHNSVMGTLRLTPNGVTAVRTNGSVQDVAMPLKTGRNWQADKVLVEQLRKAIRQRFMVDQILMMLEIDKTEMTAFEFSEKINLLYRLLGPVYGRFVSEFLNPLIDRVFAIMLRGGAFSPPPDILAAQGGIIDVEFDNPLAKAQQFEEVQAIQAGVQDLALIGKAELELRGSTQVMDILDADKAGRKIFEIRGVPASVTRSEDEVEQVRAARQQAQEQQSQVQDAAAMAQTAGNLAPLITALKPQGARAA